ncbi:hypothetical protein P9112_010613 [Eukaryota sp. TZLM1-RC]
MLDDSGLIAAAAVWDRWAELCSKGKSEPTRLPAEIEALFSTTTKSILVEDILEEDDFIAQFLSSEMVKMTRECNDFEFHQRQDLFRRLATFMVTSRKRPSSIISFGNAAKRLFQKLEDRADPHEGSSMPS